MTTAALERCDDLRSARDFSELVTIVRNAFRSIGGVGPLAIYDVAERIGWYLGIRPAEVHLHCGARMGARALGRDGRSATLEMCELPSALRRLTPAQAEDFLCLYKDHLHRFRGIP
jgi:hypothetical protein